MLVLVSRVCKISEGKLFNPKYAIASSLVLGMASFRFEQV